MDFKTADEAIKRAERDAGRTAGVIAVQQTDWTRLGFAPVFLERRYFRRCGRCLKRRLSSSQLKSHEISGPGSIGHHCQNLLHQNFTADQPNQKWVDDITCIWAREGWVYLAAIIDLFSTRMVGWAVGNRMKQPRRREIGINIRGTFRGDIHHGTPLITT